MPVRVLWYEPGLIMMFIVSDPLSLDDLERGAEELWALAAGVPNLIDLIFDYRKATNFPRGFHKIVKEGHFRLPMLDRIALVGSEPLIEMAMQTLTSDTYRPNPSIHPNVAHAAMYLRRMAEEDTTRP
jgi:hypothetical protein